MSIKKYLLKTIDQETTDLIASFHSMRSARTILAEDRGKPIYTVSIRSFWADHGECSVKVTAQGEESLRKLVARTEKEFMERNQRSDVQGAYSVTARICYGCGKDSFEEFDVPEKFFIKYKLGNRK